MVVTLCVEHGGLIPQFLCDAMPIQRPTSPLHIERVNQRGDIEVVTLCIPFGGHRSIELLSFCSVKGKCCDESSLTHIDIGTCGARFTPLKQVLSPFSTNNEGFPVDAHGGAGDI
jgi:hypothetical protein